VETRKRQKRNLLATLVFSQGPPHLSAGDELGRTQQGNNNAYCQDNELSWLDWESADAELQSFVRELIALRKRHPAFRRRSYPKAEDVIWLAARGEPMTQADWGDAQARSLGMLLLGKQLAELDERGRPVEDDDLLLLVNAAQKPVEFALPGDGWRLMLDTAAPGRLATNPYALDARSLALLVKRTTP
jgi:isoamylase